MLGLARNPLSCRMWIVCRTIRPKIAPGPHGLALSADSTSMILIASANILTSLANGFYKFVLIDRGYHSSSWQSLTRRAFSVQTRVPYLSKLRWWWVRTFMLGNPVGSGGPRVLVKVPYLKWSLVARVWKKICSRHGIVYQIRGVEIISGSAF